jgi:hypothetical protein
MTQETGIKKGQSPARWRIRLGLFILVVGWLSPLCIPLITATGLPVKWKTILSGMLAVGIPEVLTIVAIAIMGKSGYDHIKKRFLGLLKKYGPPEVVGRTRYRVGLILFALPLGFGWLAPYAPHLVPGYEAQRFYINLIGDLMLVTSLFVLGGEFWDKVRALFIHGARTQIP